MDEEQAHDELENSRLPDWITRKPPHHVAVPGQVDTFELRVVQSDLFALHHEQESLLVIRYVRRAKRDGGAEELHVRNTFVAAESSVSICSKHVSQGHLHGAQCFPHALRHILVRDDAFDPTSTCGQTRGCCERLRREVAHLLGPLHPSVLEKVESGLMPLDEPEQSEEQVQCDPIVCKTIHLRLAILALHPEWLGVSLHMSNVFLFVTEGRSALWIHYCFHPPENHTRKVLQQVEPWATDGSRSNLVPAASNVSCAALFEFCDDLNTLCDDVDTSLS